MKGGSPICPFYVIGTPPCPIHAGQSVFSIKFVNENMMLVCMGGCTYLCCAHCV